MNALQATDLVKSFHVEGRTIDVLRGVSLAVPQGAFHAVMGPSGSGKSTLLNLLAGLLPPDSGEVVLAGRPLAGLSDRALTLLRRRAVGIVFQDCNLIPTLTVAQNVALPALLDGRDLPPGRLDALLGFLEGNAAYIEAFTAEHMPAVRYRRPEGTYLAWLDFRALGMKDDELWRFMLHEAKVATDNGVMFGTNGEGRGFQRLNFACPRSQLQSAMERICTALNGRGLC